MRAHVLCLVAVLGCDSHEPTRNAPAPVGSASAPTDPWAKPAGDPWAVAPSSDPEAELFMHRKDLADRVCPAVKAPYLFAVERDGRIGHLFGTRHASVGLAKFPPVVRETFDHASLAVFEVVKHGSHKEDKRESLPDVLGAERWQHYRKLVGDDLAARAEHGPLSTAGIMMSVMYEDVGQTLDLELEREARDRHIPTDELETDEFQEQVLADLFDLRMLRAGIDEITDRDELKQSTTDDLSRFCAGTEEEPGLTEKVRKQLLHAGYTVDELAAFDDKMLYTRNRDWVPKLEKLFEQDHVFVSVGAAHLQGPRGVVELLRARGYKITRLTPP